MLSFVGKSFGETSREGLLTNVRDACKQSSSWAFALGQALAERELSSSDLWPPLLRGLQDVELNVQDWRCLLSFVSNPGLQAAHAYDIANLLYNLVKDGGKTFACDLLEEANSIAVSVWKTLKTSVQNDDIDNWLSRATNHPEGGIVEFWIHGLSLKMQGKSERFLPDNYRQWFTLVIDDTTSKGGMGRCILSSRTAFLFGLDEEWTRQNVIPLFSDPDRQKFAQAWDGFLMFGTLYPSLVDALLPAFLDAMQRVDAELNRNRRRFIEYYTALAVFHVSEPTQKLLPTLFQHGSLEDRLTFTSRLGFILRKMEQPAKQQLWKGWLCRYWQSRLQGVLAPLDENEIQHMLEWLPHMGDLFPEAVDLVVSFPESRIEHSHIIHELRNSKLVTEFAESTAKLLIFLARGLVGHNVRYLEEIKARLTLIPEQLSIELNEAFARAGILSGPK